MVFVKVRETYDLHTITNKMSIIGIHTPTSSIIKKEYPGLLMQCKAYRPVSVDIRCACASMLPADPLQVGTEEGAVAPEDLFNPILYKTLSNKGMSQLEAYINRNSLTGVNGPSVDVDRAGLSSDDFNIYYGLLADTNSWAHANPQQGFSMSNVKPLVYEVLNQIGDNGVPGTNPNGAGNPTSPDIDGVSSSVSVLTFRGNSRPMPFLNCTSYTWNGVANSNTAVLPGFPSSTSVGNAEVDVPSPRIYCAAIVVPPSRLHQLFYRLVCEWTLEFTGIRSMTEITNWAGLALLGQSTHFQSYSYGAAKTLAGLPEDSELLKEDTSMVSTSEGTDIHKVM